MSVITKMWRGLLELVYPPDIYCMCCSGFIQKGNPYSLCESCQRKLHWITDDRCERCGRRMETYGICGDCSQKKRAFAQGFSCVTYGTLEKDMIHDFKYKNKTWMGRYMGTLMAERLEREPIEIDFLVPVPLHRKRQRKRGYNQAALLAEAISKQTGIPVLVSCLTRVKETAPMTAVDRLAREENVKNAFTVSEESDRMIQKKTLLLIDDVYTTGSTADQCSRELLLSGAGSVYVLTFASGSDRSIIEIA